MTDVENWNADIEAWGLNWEQRIHYLNRLHDYHRRIEDLHWRRWERWDRAEGWFAIGAGVAALIGLAFLLLGGAR